MKKKLLIASMVLCSALSFLPTNVDAMSCNGRPCLGPHTDCAFLMSQATESCDPMSADYHRCTDMAANFYIECIQAGGTP